LLIVLDKIICCLPIDDESDSGEEGMDDSDKEEDPEKTTEVLPKTEKTGGVRVSNNLFAIKKEENSAFEATENKVLINPDSTTLSREATPAPAPGQAAINILQNALNNIPAPKSATPAIDGKYNFV